jgi:hypothetical protein
VHQRSIDYEARAGWTIVDTFHGGGEHRIETLVHLHPDLRAHRDGSTISLHWPSGVLACRLEVRAGADVALGKGWYCPQFGVKRENTVVTLSSCGPLPSSLGYRIAKPGAPTERPAAA